jgi:hypothetical protein
VSLTTSEIESTRFHLGWGNIAVGGLPYTGDGYWSIFDDIVSEYLGTGTETSATTAVSASSTTEVTPGDMTGIETYGQLVVDVAEQAEVVTVKATTGTTFTAYFTKAHASTGYPVATMSGKARLRMLLHDADQAWRTMTDIGVAKSAGLKSVDKGDVVWFEGRRVSTERLGHYLQVIGSISSLVRVPTRYETVRHGVVMMEAY